MPSLKNLFFILLTFSFIRDLTGIENSKEQNRILYLIQSGDTKTALEMYQQHHDLNQQHDRELLQQIGLVLLDQGARSSDPEIQLLTYFGAGISANDRALYILENGLKSSSPQIQLVCLNLLMRCQNDHAEEILIQAMSSQIPIIRLECAYHLCEQKMPLAVPQTEALMNKVDKEFICIFPQFYAMVGDERSNKILRRFLASPDEKVRIETIRCITLYNRENLLSGVRQLATHHNRAQEEACAAALGAMNDSSSIPKLQALSSSCCSNVKLASLNSLIHLGHLEALLEIKNCANSGNLFAIQLLGGFADTEELLWKLCQNQNKQIQINAALALLERQDPRCLDIISTILIPDARDIALLPMTSPGKSLHSWKVVSSAKQNFEKNSINYELTLQLREEILRKTLNLPENNFLLLAQRLFEKEQNDLIPTLVTLLENLQTPSSIALLKKYYQKAGAPLVRNYCNLALYRLKEEGNHCEILKTWILQQQQSDFIHFRPIMPRELQSTQYSYQLTPKETSRLLIDSFEAIAQNQEENGIYILLEAIKNGNPINKYALAGLLIRAAQ